MSQLVIPPVSDDPRRPKILVMGARRSGKTSALKVLFANQTYRQTVRSVSPTHRLEVTDVDIFSPFQIWDTPDRKTLLADMGPKTLSGFSAMIWIVDIISTWTSHAPDICRDFITAYKANPRMKLFLFLNKADGLSTDEEADDLMADVQRMLNEDIPDYMEDQGEEDLDNCPQPIPVFTSATDSRLALGFSYVIVSLLRMQNSLSSLLDTFVTSCAMDKCFLFDKETSLYIATDPSPVQSVVHGACVEWLTRIKLLEKLYLPVVPKQAPKPSSSSLPSSANHADSDGEEDDMNGLGRRSLTKSAALAAGMEFESDSEEDEEDDDSGEEEEEDEDEHAVAEEDEEDSRRAGGEGEEEEERINFQSLSLGETTLVYWELTPRIAIISILNSLSYRSRKEKIDDSISILRSALRRMLKLQSDRIAAAAPSNGGPPHANNAS